MVAVMVMSGASVGGRRWRRELWWLGDGGVGCGGTTAGEEGKTRVRASDVVGWVDRKKRNTLGVRRKNPPEKFSGGGWPEKMVVGRRIDISDNSNDPLLELPEFESFHFDPPFPRPPPEPPDVETCLHFEPDALVIDNFNELNDEQEGSDIYFSQNVEDDDFFTFVIRTKLPILTYHEVSLLSCSTGSEDATFDPDIST
ncbi:hypothetical protein Tco_0542731 [Tanacetum coccineum]